MTDAKMAENLLLEHTCDKCINYCRRNIYTNIKEKCKKFTFDGSIAEMEIPKNRTCTGFKIRYYFDI